MTNPASLLPFGFRRMPLCVAVFLACLAANDPAEAFQDARGLTAALSSGASAAAQQGGVVPTPEQTNAVFGNWTNRCFRVSDAGTPPICEVVSSIQARAQAQGDLTLNVQIAVGQSERPGWIRIAVGVPSDVLLGTPVRLTRENVAIPPLVYDRCDGRWCRAIADIDEGTLQLLMSAPGDGRLQYQTSAGQDFIVPVSFRGFQDAIAAMRAIAPLQ